MFFDPGLGKNGVACADCHAVTAEEDDGLRRSGHPLAGAARRPYWRGDTRRATFRSLGAAIEPCFQIYQGGDALPGPVRSGLVAYLKKLPGDKTPIQIQPSLVASGDYQRPEFMGGSIRRGQSLFYRACHGCHPHANREGLGGVVAGMGLGKVAFAVREGTGLLRGSQRPGAWMPFYGADRLSDRELADIAAFIIAVPGPEESASTPIDAPGPAR